MDAEKPLDNELEQELESLYRKVAGLDQPGDQHSRTVSKTEVERSAAAHIQKPIKIRSAQKKTRRFYNPILGWGLISVLFFFGAIGFLRREWLRPPVDTSLIAMPAKATKDQGVAHQHAEEKGAILKEPPIAASPSGSRQIRYAIQIRAYPEDQKQNAIMFLDELLKRSPDASMETVALAERGIWHRILLGNFSTVDEASDYRESNSIAHENPYSFIQRKLP